MNIQTTKSHSDSNGIKMLMYGASGSGKTRACAHLTKAGYKPLFVSAESGTQSLKEYEIPLVDISTDDSGKALPLEKRFDRLGEVYKFIQSGKHDFDTIYVDSLTEINKCLIAQLKSMPEYQDPKQTLKMYGQNLEMMVRLARAFRDLPYNVVLVALESVEKDEVGRRFTTADFIGQVANHLPPLMDEVLNLQVVEKDGKQVQQFQCQLGNNVKCKDRSGKLQMFESYDLGLIFKKMKQT